jgi:hypothetical protein
VKIAHFHVENPYHTALPVECAVVWLCAVLGATRPLLLALPLPLLHRESTRVCVCWCVEDTVRECVVGEDPLLLLSAPDDVQDLLSRLIPPLSILC